MSAKEMFENLGYKVYLRKSNKEFLCYRWLETEVYIRFNLIDKMILKYHSCSDNARAISIDELQAINKQIEELGWNK